MISSTERAAGRGGAACRRPVLVSALVVSCFLAGCGRGDGPRRFEVSGKVTFDDMPVPAGRIQFEPDTSKANKGPAGYARIKDGTYSTQQTGKGTVGGPHVVVILGFDGKPRPGVELDSGTPMFPEYRSTVDLPEEPTTKDFDVPGKKTEHSTSPGG